MNKFLNFLLHPITLTVFALLCLSSLIWWLGPLITWNSEHPLDGTWERLGAIGVLLLLFVLGFLLRQWRRRRTNAKLMSGMSGGPSSSDREVQVLQQRFQEALKVLEDSAKQSGKRSFFKR